MCYALLGLGLFGLLTSTVFAGIVMAAVPRFLRERREALAALAAQPEFAPPVTLFKPLHGADPGLEAYLETFFAQDYPEYEILFCARSAEDAGLETARRVAARYPHIPAKFFSTGGEPDYINDKVISMEKMEAEAAYGIFVISDSDVRVTPDYLRAVVLAFADERVGAMTCPYRGVAAEGGLWARLEAVGMSVEMTAGVLAARRMEGMQFVLGPTMAFRREVQLTHKSHEPEVRRSPETPPALSDVSRDLTQAAIEGQLGPVLGRDLEIEGLIEVLSNLRNGDPILVGESGAGKAAIVEALAQRIVEGMAPPFLLERRILAFDSQLAPGRQLMREHLQALVKPGTESFDTILFVGDLRSLLAPGSALGSAIGVLRSSPQRSVRCIATSTPGDFKECVRAAPWLMDSFRAIYVRSLGVEETLSILKARKQVYERFHEVTYAEEALEFAAQSADRYLPERALPGKAFELLDAAAARVKMRQGALPDEIVEVQKRIRFIVHRMDSAIANHEFEKARFYSDEERKERENLRMLREQHSLEDAPSNEVTREDVEEVIARWSIYPFRPWE
jgi:hypothetical protein